LKNTSLKTNNLRQNLSKSFLVILCLFLNLSCKNAFVLSEKSIKHFYQNHPPLPNFEYLDTLERKVFFAENGEKSKPLLLMIHGAPGAWFGYKEFLSDSALLKKYRIISFDRLGYNKSSKNTESIDFQTLIYSSFLKKSIDKVVIIGRSYGAPIAAKLAMDYPEKISRLILVAPACDPTQEKFWWFSNFANTNFSRFFLPKYANQASTEKFRHVEDLKKIEIGWRKITCPVTILQGGTDWIINPENGNYVDSMLKNAPRRFIFLPNNRHLLTLERPDLIKEILLE
jgi:pimeloyl-ACP methyl ester carboxylesterase